MLRGLLLTAVIAAAVGGTGLAAPAAPPYASLVHLYDYDAAAPLGIRVEAVEDGGQGVTVHYLSFASPKGGRATAALALPSRRTGRAPAIIIQPGFSSRSDEVVPDAVSFARRGVIALALDAPHVRVGGTPFRCRAGDRAVFVRYAVELRRAVDLLAGRSDVDAARIGYTGFSYGAAVGGTLSGIEHRIRAFALQSGGPRFSAVQRSQCAWLGRKRLARYVRVLETTDSIAYVGHAAPSALLFQNGTRDRLYTRASIRRYFAAASAPKTLRWYRADHSLSPRATADRDAFLRAHLGF
jgi:uncharacterized protein